MNGVRTLGIGLALIAACSCSSHPLLPSIPNNPIPPRTYYVAPNGSNSNPGTLGRPFRTIQHGLDVATRPGDAVVVRAGIYFEGITFPADGGARNPIGLRAYPGERPFISGDKMTPQKLVRIFNRSHIRFSGFEVGRVTATTPTQSGAIFVEGFGDDIEIADTIVRDVKPAAHTYANGRAIQVRGYDASHALTNVVVADNEIDRCTVQDGNILEVSGNASHVRIVGNRMRDNRGIALNVTGGTHPPRYVRWRLQVSNVLVAGNTVDSTSGAGAIGIYVQASRSVEVRHNTVARSGWGMYVTSEYPHVHSSDITIAYNVITDNAEAGLLVGSPFFPTTVLGAVVTGNTVLRNGAYESGNGGNFGIGRARNVAVRNNQLVAADDQPLTYLGAPYTGVTLNENCYDDASHNSAGARFQYAGQTYVGFKRYRSQTGEDRSSRFGGCGR